MGCGRRALDLLSHSEESLLDVRRILGTGLQHRDPDLFGELLSDSVFHHLLVGQITLVAHEEFVNSLAGIAINLLQPLLDVGEGVGVGYVVDDNDAVRAAVVGGGDGAESLLPGGVPLLLKRERGEEREGGLVSELRA